MTAVKGCEAAVDLDLFGEGQGVGAALVVDGDEALLDVNVGGAILAHGAQLHQVALWCQLLHTTAIQCVHCDVKVVWELLHHYTRRFMLQHHSEHPIAFRKSLHQTMSISQAEHGLQRRSGTSLKTVCVA